jgi:hypothetical protein
LRFSYDPLLSDLLLSESLDCQFIATVASSSSAVVWRSVAFYIVIKEGTKLLIFSVVIKEGTKLQYVVTLFHCDPIDYVVIEV